MSEGRPNLIEVFEHYGARVLNGRGPWRKAYCPLLSHEDQNPSATLNEEAGKWHCWSCDNAGDVYDIVIANEDSCAGWVDAKHFCETTFGVSSGDVRAERGRGGRVPGRAGNHGSGSTWVPPWKVS